VSFRRSAQESGGLQHHPDDPGPRESRGEQLLAVDNLSVAFSTGRGTVTAVDGVGFNLSAGSTLGVVGESGSGKTVMTRSIMQLLPKRDTTLSGSVIFEGRELVGLPEDEVRKVRGARIGLVMQDSMTALNPVRRVGVQISECLTLRTGVSRKQAREPAIDLLRSVRIPEPELRFRQYPHELSGGMRQRIAIAIALSLSPSLLIADEPTTALDVTVQAQILDLLSEHQRKRMMGMILVSHDLDVLAGRADDIIVMYAGQIVEHAPAKAIFSRPRMPYTQALLASRPRINVSSHTTLPTLEGHPPRLAGFVGCRFAPRCPYVQEKCRHEAPPLSVDEAGSEFRCWFPLPPDGATGGANSEVDRVQNRQQIGTRR
jgi:oligopeptide/dipeptide ABC transporter ATP-binding protein